MEEKRPSDFPKDLPVLTSLRFYAALFTGLFHIEYLSGLYFPEIIRRIFVKSYLAVDFFFILSGFILAHTYLNAYRNNNFSYRSFLVKRLARIYPVHIFTFAVIYLCLLVMWSQDWPMQDNAFFMYDFIQHLTLMHAWDMTSRLNYNMVSWSISAEWFAYLCFPLFLLLTTKTKTPLNFLILTLTLMAVLWCLAIGRDSLHLTQLTTAGIYRITPLFMLGIGLYLWAKENTFPFKKDAFIGVCLILLVLLAVFQGPDFYAVPILSLMILTGAEQARSGKPSYLCHPVNVYCGQTSYSFYMVQYVLWYILMYMFIKIIMGYNGDDLFIYIIWFLSLFLVQLSAMALYHGIEKPCRVWIVKKWATKKP